MKKILIFVSAFLLAATQVFAAGSGSGGGFEPVVEPPEPAPVQTQTDAETETEPMELPPAEETPAPTPTPTPASSSNEWVAQPLCNDIDDLKARITCRLDKNNEQLEREYSQSYLPEECRPLTGGDQQICINKYISLLPCWDEEVGPDRISCVKDKLGLPERIVSPDNYCSDDAESESCKSDYRYKVYSLITFRFYDAEERVEEWYEEGKLSQEETVDFIAFIAESKVEFYASTSSAARRNIITFVMGQWAEVVEKVKSSSNSNQ